jgi:hypothetical protein
MLATTSPLRLQKSEIRNPKEYQKRENQKFKTAAGEVLCLILWD